MSLQVWKRRHLSRGSMKESAGEIQPRKTCRKTRFRSAKSQRRPDLYCGRWPHSATCVCCSPANCLLLLWSRSLLIPTHDQERQLNLTDAKDHITCSYVTVRLFMSYPSLPTRGSMLITPEDVQGGGLFQCKEKSSIHKGPLTQ